MKPILVCSYLVAGFILGSFAAPVELGPPDPDPPNQYMPRLAPNDAWQAEANQQYAECLLRFFRARPRPDPGSRSFRVW